MGFCFDFASRSFLFCLFPYMKAPDNVVVVPTRTERPAIFDPFKSKTIPPIIAIAAKINANICPRNDLAESVLLFFQAPFYDFAVFQMKS